MKTFINITLAGCGTVGTAVAERLIAHRSEIERRTGVACELRSIVIADPTKRRSAPLDAALFTADARRAIDDAHVDVVVECIGGTGIAAEIVERALDRGRHVVTANKELIATQGPRLHALAVSRGATLHYEAAVGGAMPIVRLLDDALAGDRVMAVAGVLNGTCTAILSAMDDGLTFAQSLATAQQFGYAEADPRGDVEGDDAAHKLAIVVQRAFGLAVLSSRIARRGIDTVTAAQVVATGRRGLRIRLVAAAAADGNGGIRAEVAPVAIPQAHPFAQTCGPQNAVRLWAESAGVIDLRGNGAGGEATASAVLSDVVATLRAIGERHDLRYRRRRAPLEAAAGVAPLFSALEPSGIGELPLWNDERIASPACEEALA